MQYRLFIAALAAAALNSVPLLAQSRYKSDETIIIRKDKPQTVIEIRDGQVLVDGEQVTKVEDGKAGNIRKKIIIRGGGTAEPALPGAPDRDPGEADAAEAPHHAILGVMTNTRNREEGALIVGVNPGSPAESAGLKAGDRITELDGKRISDAAALTREVGSRHRPGDEVNIIYERNGKVKTTTAKLEAAPEGFGSAPDLQDDRMRAIPRQRFFREFRFPDDDRFEEAPGRPQLGLSVEDNGEGRGVRIAGVAPGSAAAKAGLKEGDILTGLDGVNIRSASQLQQLVTDHRPGDKLSLSYRRNGTAMTADAVLPKPAVRMDL